MGLLLGQHLTGSAANSGAGANSRSGHWRAWRQALLALPLALLALQTTLVGRGAPEAVLRVVIPVTIFGALPFLLLLIRYRGVQLVLVGLALNLSVIVVNGGLMPVTPQTVARLSGPDRPATLTIGQRVPGSKDVLLERADVRLAGFADRFVVGLGRVGAVYSLGDVFVLIGLCLALPELAARLLRKGEREIGTAPDAAPSRAAV